MFALEPDRRNFDENIDPAAIERTKSGEGKKGGQSKSTFGCCGCGGRPSEEKRKPGRSRRSVADVALAAEVVALNKGSVAAAGDGKATNFTRTITA